MSEDRTSTGAPPVQDPAPAEAQATDPEHTQAVSPVDPADEPAPEPPTGLGGPPAARDDGPQAPDDLGVAPVGPGAVTAPATAPEPHRTPAAPTQPAAPAAEAPADRTGGPGAAAAGAPTTVLPSAAARPARPAPPRVERPAAEPRSGRTQPRAAGRRRARLVVQRIDAWSVFLFSLVASICLGVVLVVAVAALYAALSSLGVLGSLNGVLGEVAGSGTADEVVEPLITSSRVLGATAVLAAIDVVLLTALATLGALLYNLCASLTGGIEVQLGERD